MNHLKTDGKHETLTDLDFLKEDMYASARFAIDPKVAEERMKLRFTNDNKKEPIARSFVGTRKTYLDYRSILEKREQ